MPGQTVGIFMSTGFPGSFSRSGDYIVESRPVDPLSPFPVFFGDALFQFSYAPIYGNGVYRSAQALSASFSGISNGTNVVSGIANTALLFNGSSVQVGMGFVGPGVSVGTQVVSFTANSITISQAATSSVASTFSILSQVLTPSGFCGVAVREVQTNRVYSSQASTAFYSQGSQADVLMRGSASVLVTQPIGIAPFGQVFLRVGVNPAQTYLKVGGFEAANDYPYTLVVPNTQFSTGTIDNNGVAEISILTRNCA
jgi:hypothetical protein